MRKVMVSGYTVVNGKAAIAEKGVAIFHGFGMDFEEFEAGHAQYSTAIIEWPDGTVEMPAATLVRFLKDGE